MHGYGPWDGHMAWAAFWWIFGLIALVAVIWAIVVAVSRGATAGGAPRQEAQRPFPEEILHERYARGDIDRATHDAMLEDIRQQRAASGPRAGA